MIGHLIKWTLRIAWHGLATVALVAFVLAWTSLPSQGIGWLAMRGEAPEKTTKPAHIVVLGGGGIPSASGLTRTFAAAELYALFPEATWWVSLPADGDPETSAVGRMRDELVLRGIPAEQIRLEHDAVNTHEQAVQLKELLPRSALAKPIMLVSSPEHMRRAVRSFEAQGFQQVFARTAQEAEVDADVGSMLSIRYGFWQNLESQVQFLRECVALLVYRVRGWA